MGHCLDGRIRKCRGQGTVTLLDPETIKEVMLTRAALVLLVVTDAALDVYFRYSVYHRLMGVCRMVLLGEAVFTVSSACSENCGF